MEADEATFGLPCKPGSGSCDRLKYEWHPDTPGHRPVKYRQTEELTWSEQAEFVPDMPPRKWCIRTVGRDEDGCAVED
jgi:hypothetical protein